MKVGALCLSGTFLALQFMQGHKKAVTKIRNCLIFFVDQLGLEPRTSRL